MKKMMMLMALAMPSFAGMTTPSSTVVPAAAPAAAPCPWTVELGGQYNMAVRDYPKYSNITTKNVDTYGGDVTLCRRIADKHSVNLRFAYTYGNVVNRWNDDNFSSSLRTRENNFFLMPGYRYTQEIGNGWSWFAGVNAGVCNMNRRDRIFLEDDEDNYAEKAHDASWGFAASGELGIRKEIIPHMEAFVAYQLSGNTADPKLRWDEDETMKTHRQIYNGLRAGLSYCF